MSNQADESDLDVVVLPGSTTHSAHRHPHRCARGSPQPTRLLRSRTLRSSRNPRRRARLRMARAARRPRRCRATRSCEPDHSGTGGCRIHSQLRTRGVRRGRLHPRRPRLHRPQARHRKPSQPGNRRRRRRTCTDPAALAVTPTAGPSHQLKQPSSQRTPPRHRYSHRPLAARGGVRPTSYATASAPAHLTPTATLHTPRQLKRPRSRGLGGSARATTTEPPASPGAA